MDIIHSVAIRIILFYRELKLQFARKVHLRENTILVNPDSWRSFDSTRFESCGYNFSTAHIATIAKRDLSKIVAYIGQIDHKYIKRLPEQCRWVQIHSHGFNGYDNLALYKNKDIVVSNVFGVYNEPISQYCIAAYFYYNTLPFSRITGGGI